MRLLPASTLAAVLAAVACVPLSVAAQPDRAALDSARAIMAAARYATFVTIGSDGRPQARIVDPAPPDSDFVVRVGTNARTRKVREIRANPRVTMLWFNAARSEYVTVVGTARIVNDTTERIRAFLPVWGSFYPNGPRGSDFVLIRVTPVRVEISSSQRGLRNDRETWRPVVIDMPVRK